MNVLYKYTENRYKLQVQRDFKKKEKTKVKYDTPITDLKELQRIQISRIKRMIYEYSFCNDFKFFGTITIDSKVCDRYNLEECFKILRKTINQMKNKYKWKKDDFRYLIICEKHVDGAFHFHGLFSEVLENDLYINNNLYLSSSYFDRCGKINSWSIIDNKEACACYIQKYIIKDFVKTINGTTYICSRGLKRAEKFYIENLEHFEDFSGFDYENDFVKSKDINLFTDKDLTFYLTFYANYYEPVVYRKTNLGNFVKNLLTNKKNNNILNIT